VGEQCPGERRVAIGHRCEQDQLGIASGSLAKEAAKFPEETTVFSGSPLFTAARMNQSPKKGSSSRAGRSNTMR